MQKRESVSEIEREFAKKCLIDFIGTAFSGEKSNASTFSRIKSLLPNGLIPIYGSSVKTDGLYACIFNSFNSHSTELDDGNRFSMMHLGSSIISSLISLLDRFEIKTDDFLDGIVVGYEAACRLSKAIQPSHKTKGFHTSGTCGTVGSAIACSIALNYNKEQLISVLSCATTSASGLLEIQENSSTLKPYNISNASINGLIASMFGQTNLSGPEDILNGERGFLKLFSDKADEAELLKEDPCFEITRTYFKVYSSCRHCHSPVEAALNLRNLIDINTISRINIYIYKNAIKGHDHKIIKGIQSAKLSIPYCVAAALYAGVADLRAFDIDLLENDRIKYLINCCYIYEKKEFTNDLVNSRQTIVEIEDANGTHKKHILIAKGEPENPLSIDDLINKYRNLTNNNPTYINLLDKINNENFDIKSLMEV